MSCEQFKTAISKAAAMGDGALLKNGHKLQKRPPQTATATGANAELQTHLVECASCREWQVSEQQLFGAIEGELSALANAETKPSFLPRVRAAIEAEGLVGGTARSWFVLWPVTAALVAIFLVIAVFQRSPSHSQGTPQVTASGLGSEAGSTLNSARSEISGRGTSEGTSVGTSRGASDLRPKGRQLAIGQDVPKPHSASRLTGNDEKPAAGLRKLEVLVPPDEREALARFVAELPQRRELAIALTTPVKEVPSTVVGSEPLQIAALKVAPLSPAEAQ